MTTSVPKKEDTTKIQVQAPQNVTVMVTGFSVSLSTLK